MNILIACECSGVVREAFNAYSGFNAMSCDIKPCEDGRVDYHIQGDAIQAVRRGGWDLVIAHPPCTFLANSGVRWLYNNDGFRNTKRWEDMKLGVRFFADLWNACGDIPRAFENPVMHCHAAHRLCDAAPSIFANGRPQIIQLPRKERNRVHFATPGPQRAADRSRTLSGIAEAMAEQWGQLPVK